MKPTLTAILVLLAAGCGATRNPGSAGDGQAGRTTPTQSLREACPIMADLDIETGLMLFAAAREEGASRDDCYSVASAGCEEWPSQDQYSCIVCMTHVIEHVYR